jgi:hypothetical protein
VPVPRNGSRLIDGTGRCRWLEACVFIAAHPWDLAAARHGFRTGYVDRVSSSPAEMAAYARRFDHVATDLAALGEQLPRAGSTAGR